MHQFLHVGALDGEAMIELNNVAVGYLIPTAQQPCVYPPQMPVQIVAVEVLAPPSAEKPTDAPR